MTNYTDIDSDAIWLRTKDYGVVPLNSRLSAHVSELAAALDAGLPAYPDSSRQDFYDLELQSGWYYVHVHDDAQTVYLVAFSAATP
jgi:hypothetical protein